MDINYLIQRRWEIKSQQKQLEAELKSIDEEILASHGEGDVLLIEGQGKPYGFVIAARHNRKMKQSGIEYLADKHLLADVATVSMSKLDDLFKQVNPVVINEIMGHMETTITPVIQSYVPKGGII